MVDVARAPRPAIEEDDPDEAAFTDDDQPTTLAQDSDKESHRGEDAYVQMAPIADALEISIPNEAPEPLAVVPVPYEPEPDTVARTVTALRESPVSIVVEAPVVEAPVIEPPVALPVALPRRRRWPIAVAILAVVAVAAVLIVMFLGDSGSAPAPDAAVVAPPRIPIDAAPPPPPPPDAAAIPIDAAAAAAPAPKPKRKPVKPRK